MIDIEQMQIDIENLELEAQSKKNYEEIIEVFRLYQNKYKDESFVKKHSEDSFISYGSFRYLKSEDDEDARPWKDEFKVKLALKDIASDLKNRIKEIEENKIKEHNANLFKFEKRYRIGSKVTFYIFLCLTFILFVGAAIFIAIYFNNKTDEELSHISNILSIVMPIFVVPSAIASFIFGKISSDKSDWYQKRAAKKVLKIENKAEKKAFKIKQKQKQSTTDAKAKLNNSTMLKLVMDFNKEIIDVDYTLDIDYFIKKYIKVRDNVLSYYNSPTELTQYRYIKNTYKFSLDDMKKGCDEMMKYILDKMTSPQGDKK